jgi:hypothetical protein
MVYRQRFIVQKSLWEFCFRKASRSKKLFRRLRVDGFGIQAFSGDETSRQPPDSVEKNRCAPRSILPAFELETPSDLCDTKF